MKCIMCQSLYHLQECISDLDQRRMVSISMDGPNVNWKFFEMLQQEHGEHNGGKQLAVVGTCGLHTLHNDVNRVHLLAYGEDIKSSSLSLLKCASKKRGLHQCDGIKHFRPTLLWAPVD